MHFVIKTVDREKPYYTDTFKNQETGERATEKEVMPQFLRIAEYLGSLDYISVPMDGRVRYFNPKNIVYIEMRAGVR